MLNDRGIAVIKAANSAGAMVAILALVYLFSFNRADELISVVFAFFLAWIAALFLGTFLMIFLGPIFEMVTTRISLFVFLFAGFGITFGLCYFASSIGAHGQPSNLESDWNSAMGLILIYSLIGSISAYSAWRTLKKKTKDDNT